MLVLLAGPLSEGCGRFGYELLTSGDEGTDASGPAQGGDAGPPSDDGGGLGMDAGGSQPSRDGGSADSGEDLCPADDTKTVPGECGCGNPDEDANGNGVLDCMDPCPQGSIKAAPGECGCDKPDTDSDMDGTADCNDPCPQDPQKLTAGACGCGVPDTDGDMDGVPDCDDACPGDPQKTSPGDCGCLVEDVDTNANGTSDCLEQPSKDWKYRSQLTVASSQISGDLTYFPVLVNTTRGVLRSEANGGHVSQPDGGDILFTAADGITKLDHEIERYVPATGEVWAWVKMPRLSASSDTIAYMYYGNSSNVPDQWNSQAVWDDGGANLFRAVWHLNETGTAARSDSTSHQNHCSPQGYEGDEGVTGLIGGADMMDGEDDWLSCPADPSLNIRDQVTISAWLQQRKIGEAESWVNGPWVASGYSFFLFATTDKFSGLGIDFKIDRKGIDKWDLGTAEMFPAEWHHVVVTFDGTAIRGYVNGVLDLTYSAPGTIADTSGVDLTIGKDDPGVDGLAMDGMVDEARVSSTARSLDWISASFNNQKAPGSFVNVGAEEAR